LPSSKAAPASATGKSRKKAKRPTNGVDATLTRQGGLSYLEIPALDAKQSATFYKKILGWTVRRDEGDGAKFSDPSGHLIGRWVANRAISRKPGFLQFFYVNRVDAVAKRVAALGGEIVRAPYAESNLRISIIRDPAGNTIGLWSA
jgi:uncharacterized protein